MLLVAKRLTTTPEAKHPKPGPHARPFPPLHSPWLRVVAAAALAALTNLAYRAIDPQLAHPTILGMLGLLAIIASTWAGRLVAGSLTLLLEVALLIYYLPPAGTLELASLAELRQVLIFLTCGIVVAVIVDALHAGKIRSESLAREREATASALLLERQRLSALLSNLPALVWEIRVEPTTGKLWPTFFSANAGRLLGRASGDLVEGPLTAATFGRDGAAVLAALRDVAGGAPARQLKHRWSEEGERDRWFETCFASGSSEETQHVRCVSIDVTDAERVGAELASSEERFRAVADAAPTPVWIARPADGLVWANDAWLEFRGRTLAEETGKGWLEGVHPEDRLELALRLNDALGSANEIREEFRARRADGAWRWLHWVGVPRRDSGGELRDYVGFVLDMSDRRQLDIEREALLDGTERARQAAELATQSRDDFLAKVSHELRNPLNGILGWTQVLKRDGASEEELARGLEVIDLGARALVQLVDDLLDVSRISAGKMRLSLAPTDLSRVVESACQTVSPSAAAKGVELDCRFDSTPHVMGDAERLRQVVWNLLSNAVKFTPRGGRVEARLDASEGQARLVVADSGVGIAPEFLASVFAPFSQQEESSTRRFRGLGLGLAIVRQLTELHGGTVHAHSDGLGRGATFEIRLPLAGESATARPEPARRHAGEESGLPLAGLRILVVDDDPTARDLVPRLLTAQGASVQTADSAETGLAAILVAPPDLLLSDIEMPQTDGLEFIRRVRTLGEREGGSTPAAALTAYVRDEERRRILLAGFQAHIAKPVDRDRLTTTILGLVRSRNPPAPH